MNQTPSLYPSAAPSHANVRHESNAAQPGHQRIAFIHAQWHADIVHKARDAFLAELARHHVPPDHVDVIELPGAYEIPLHAQRLAATGRYSAIVACGLVVDGGIYRHEFVADAVISGLMRVMLDSGVPVISCVLTPKNFHDHEEHRRFFADHFVVKGGEAARACVATMASLKRLAAQGAPLNRHSDLSAQTGGLA